jgi:hypothetical protein
MITIGEENWVQKYKALTDPHFPDFWLHFEPVSEKELRKLELSINRTLDPEFKEFYRSIGYGEFPNDTLFYAPTEIFEQLWVPITFNTGANEDYATEEQIIKMWLTKGETNPVPNYLTDEMITLGEAKLYDLLPYGTDQAGTIHMLYVGSEPAPFRCALNSCASLDDMMPTFSLSLANLVREHFESEDISAPENL